MDSSDATFWFSTLVNIALASVLAAHFRRRVKSHAATEAKAKVAYSWLCVGLGIFSGFAVFLGTIVFFNLPVGHGEVLIAAPLLYLLLSGALIVVGRIVIFGGKSSVIPMAAPNPVYEPTAASGVGSI